MASHIYHSDRTLVTGRVQDGECGVFLFHSGTVLLEMGTIGTRCTFHTDADGLRAVAKLLNEAVEKLAVEEVAA